MLPPDQHFGAEYFRWVAEATYDWESWHDQVGQVIWVNPAAERITGYTVEECLKMPRYPLPMVFEEDVARVAELYQGFANHSTGNDIEFRVKHREGHLVVVAISWQPMFDALGVHLGCRTSIRDMSERQELHQHNARYNEQLEKLVQETTGKLLELERRRDPVDESDQSLHTRRAESERAYLIELMEGSRGNVTHAARKANMSRQGFHKLLKRHGLSSSQFRE